MEIPHKSCAYCEKTFYKRSTTSAKDWEQYKCCSLSCSAKVRGTTQLTKYQFKKGQRPNPSTEFKKGQALKENNVNWKGDAASYQAKHMWVRYHYGPAISCTNEFCKGESFTYHWSNISGEYKRERNDWQQLCVPCHKAYDIKALGGKIRARAVKQQPNKACLECGKTFSKTPKESHVQWLGRNYCGRKCGSAVSARARFGIRQSDATRALKSQKLVERWQRPEWREMMSTKMLGNQYAKKA